MNVEPPHAAGIKGQGVKVMVLDDGVDIRNEDLSPNVNSAMTFNFESNSTDPTPGALYPDAAHGTNVAGIIAAAQNGIGVMGIAPRAVLGGARFLVPATISPDVMLAYGGASWSKDTDVFNASFGGNPEVPPSYDDATASSSLTAVRALPNLRGGKGAVFVKASGNEFEGLGTRTCPTTFSGIFSCENPVNDTETLESNIVTVAALNAKGVKASYSNAGSVNWVTGLGGEYGAKGIYGENQDSTSTDGPVMFSTDLSGCTNGYSKSSVSQGFLNGTSQRGGVADNAGCNYSYMNGTSAATPTVAGVVALVLQANPALTWRDVREILRATARKIDDGYETRSARNTRVDLTSTTPTLSTVVGTKTDYTVGATSVPLELGWQKNGAGYWYSNWYGFGLVDASAAVTMAKSYASNSTPSQGAGLPVNSTPFSGANAADLTSFAYGTVTKIGQLQISGTGKVDQMQVRVSGSICIGAVGIAVKSPSGMVSLLATPYNIYYAPNAQSATSTAASVSNYTLGSFAFYGEPTIGTWEIYAISGMPSTTNCSNAPGTGTLKALSAPLTPLKVEGRVIPLQ